MKTTAYRVTKKQATHSFFQFLLISNGICQFYIYIIKLERRKDIERRTDMGKRKDMGNRKDMGKRLPKSRKMYLSVKWKLNAWVYHQMLNIVKLKLEMITQIQVTLVTLS